MATRDVMDERIDVWKDHYKDLQREWRRDQSTTGNYGQVIRGNVRPSDQPEDGPQLPANLKDEGRVDVKETPDGFGWWATFDAQDDGVDYERTVGSFEDGPLVETPWTEALEEVVP